MIFVTAGDPDHALGAAAKTPTRREYHRGDRSVERLVGADDHRAQ